MKGHATHQASHPAKYLSRTISLKSFINLFLDVHSLELSGLDSLNSLGIQMADFVAGAVRRKHELGDDSYYDTLSPRIVVEKMISRV